MRTVDGCRCKRREAEIREGYVFSEMQGLRDHVPLGQAVEGGYNFSGLPKGIEGKTRRCGPVVCLAAGVDSGRTVMHGNAHLTANQEDAPYRWVVENMEQGISCVECECHQFNSMSGRATNLGLDTLKEGLADNQTVDQTATSA